MKPTLCLTFDNMGQARQVFTGNAALADPEAPMVKLAFPLVLDMLADLRVEATFFVEGWSALHFPGTIEKILSGGHEVGLHGWIHEDFASLDERTALQYVNDGTAVLRHCGAVPVGFRAPGGLRGAFTADILTRLGYLYDSSVDTPFDADAPTREDDDYQGDMVTMLRPRLASISWRWSVIDAIHYVFSNRGLREPRLVLDYWSSLLDHVATNGGLLTMIFHPHLVYDDPEKMAAMRTIIARALDYGFDVLPAREVAAAHMGKQTWQS
jgi:peptidoglycan/xylan/chitin deacetylase (PgdA/CDA1 family)